MTIKIKESKSANVKDLIKKTKHKKKGKQTVKMTKKMSKIEKQLAIVEENLSSLPMEDFELVTNELRVQAYIKNIRKAKEYACDLECSGLHPIDDTIAGICLYTPTDVPIYIPVGHVDLEGNPIDMNFDRPEMLKDILEDMTIDAYYSNGGFDLAFLKEKYDIDGHISWDTQVGGAILNENERHALKELWPKYCSNGQTSKAEKFSTLFNKLGFQYTDPRTSIKYAAKDPKMTFEVTKFQQQYLKSDSPLRKIHKLYTEIELPVIKVFRDMRLKGFNFDADECERLRVEYTKKLDELDKPLQEFFGSVDLSTIDPERAEKVHTPINFNSWMQKQVIFYDALKLEHDLPKRRYKADSTCKQVIDNMIEKYREDKPEISKYLKLLREWSQTKTLVDKFISKLPAQVSKKTGKIHASTNQNGTVTGRVSMSDPNLQQIPSRNKDIRKVFIASEGKVLISGDYSQEEPMILAHVSKDPNMIMAFKNGKDIYATIASFVYNKPYDQCLEFGPDGIRNPQGKKLRDSMKPVILGKMYGRSTPAIADELNITNAEAQKIVDLFDNKFPNVQSLIITLNAFASAYGYVETVYDRKRRLPDMTLANNWRNQDKISSAKRQVLNSVIQGTAGDIMKIAIRMIHYDQELRDLGFELILTVHDEIIGEGPRENAVKIANRLRTLMIEAPKERIDLPFKVDVEISDKWYGEPLFVEELKRA